MVYLTQSPQISKQLASREPNTSGSLAVGLVSVVWTHRVRGRVRQGESQATPCYKAWAAISFKQ